MMFIRTVARLLTSAGAMTIATASLVTACDVAQVTDANPEHGAAGTQREGNVSFPIDRHAGLSAADGTPSDSEMMGDHGILSYRNGCLFLARDGKMIGLVAPANSRFDGRTFFYRNMRLPLGQQYEFSGSVARPSEISGLHCRGAPLIIKIAP